MADTDLRLSAVRGQILTEDYGRGSSHSNREVSQDWCKDGPPLLMPPDTEEDPYENEDTLLLEHVLICMLNTKPTFFYF